MKLNPIFESSARRRMRTGKTALILTAYMAALLVFSLSRLSVFFGQGVTVGRMRLGTEAYIWQTALQLALIVVVAPALGAVSIAGERERQTFDLLLVTGVGTRKIVLGKLMESFAFIALLILAGAPVMMLAHVTAGIPVLRVLETLIYLMAIALEALAVGMVCSALCRRTLSAMVMTYLAIGLLGGGAWALAKHGPLAAHYTYESLRALGGMSTAQILMGMPLPVFFCPAVGLVSLLAHQTGILHTTMQSTLRLFDIYSAMKAAGFGAAAAACFGATYLSTVLLITLATGIVHLQTGLSYQKG
ncbi:MAG: ABC transporter permease subunit [Candidatus Ventricola sp.]|nr:ABC transporter permease subunit [Candidatus Ventricola sp.]